MSATVQVRPATPDDAEPIERIRIRGWQVGYRHVFPPAELDALEVDWSRWAEGLSDPGWNQRCLVAEEAERVVGWATYGPSGEPERCGRLNGLYVDPDRWGRGAGRALLGHAEAELAATWAEAILWTLADNPRTRRFYEAAGWDIDGAAGTFDRFGVSATIVRYRKRLTSSTSRP